MMTTATINIKPKSDRSRWVALSLGDKPKILFEGVKMEVVIKKANKTGKSYIMQFVPKPDSAYIL
jgi:hypothetical protein